MSTTKRESLHQVQKSYQHTILLHPQGSHPKEIKSLTHSLHGQITCSVFDRYTPCPAKETGKNTKSLIQRETKTEDYKGTKILILQKIACALLPQDFSTRLFLRIAALFVETIDKLLVRMIDTINPQSN